VGARVGGSRSGADRLRLRGPSSSSVQDRDAGDGRDRVSSRSSNREPFARELCSRSGDGRELRRCAVRARYNQRDTSPIDPESFSRHSERPRSGDSRWREDRRRRRNGPCRRKDRARNGRAGSVAEGWTPEVRRQSHRRTLRRRLAYLPGRAPGDCQHARRCGDRSSTCTTRSRQRPDSDRVTVL
jgi:hypothetical protein